MSILSTFNSVKNIVNSENSLAERLAGVVYMAGIFPLVFALANYFLIKSSLWVFFWSWFVGFAVFSAFASAIYDSIETHNKFPKITFIIFLPIIFFVAHFYIGVLAMSVVTAKTATGAFFSFFIPTIIFVLIGIGISFILKNLFLKIDSSFINNFATNDLTSFANPKKILRGFLWSNFYSLANTLRDGIYIDNFEVIDNTIKVGKKDIEAIKNTDLKIKTLDFTKTMLAIGKAGSGKTEFFLNIASQNRNFQHFKRELYHDVKGDFVQKLYSSKTDFILNLYDDRGLNWDLWEDMKHNENIINSFAQNLITSQVDKPDFWTSSAGALLTDTFRKVHFSYKNLSSKQKWQKLIDLLEDYKENIYDDKTKQSIWQTLELGLNTIKMMAHDGIYSDKKPFSLNKWANSYDSRLFLLNNASYSKALNPYFTGFLACLIEILLSKPDTKSDFTLMVLDEYLSLKLDEDVRLKMLTQIRSKGGCLILGVQFLDANDKKQKQLIGSSTYAKFLFNVSDDETVDTFVKAYGNVEFEKDKISTSSSTSKNSGGGNSNSSSSSSSTSRSTEDKNLPFLTPQIIKGLTNYKHLTLIDEKQLYYVGYTKKVDFTNNNEMFVKKSLEPFYEWVYNVQHNQSKIENISDNIVNEVVEIDVTDELLKRPYAEQLEIYTALESDELMTDDETDDFLNRYNLHDVDLQRFVREFEEK